MDLLKKAQESGAIDKAVDAAAGSKDKVVDAVKAVGGDAAATKVGEALSDTAGLKAQLNAAVGKVTGGGSAAPAPQ